MTKLAALRALSQGPISVSLLEDWQYVTFQKLRNEGFAVLDTTMKFHITAEGSTELKRLENGQ